MAISMIPPTALILFPKIFPITLPNKKPPNDREKVTYASVLRNEGSCYGEKGIVKTVSGAGEQWHFGIEKLSFLGSNKAMGTIDSRNDLAI